jgi:hypothetical protein
MFRSFTELVNERIQEAKATSEERSGQREDRQNRVDGAGRPPRSPKSNSYEGSNEARGSPSTD